jgi:hypothetical protein
MSSCRSPNACETRIPVSANSANRNRSRSRRCAAITATICANVSTFGNSRTVRSRPTLAREIPFAIPYRNGR